jgi:hypothetical protein
MQVNRNPENLSTPHNQSVGAQTATANSIDEDAMKGANVLIFCFYHPLLMHAEYQQSTGILVAWESE